jgi:hypothetical protein
MYPLPLERGAYGDFAKGRNKPKYDYPLPFKGRGHLGIFARSQMAMCASAAG